MLDSMIDPDCDVKRCKAEYWLNKHADELYDEAAKMIGIFMCTRDYYFFFEKFRKALQDKDEWAYYMSDEIELNRKHVAVLVGDYELLEDLLSEEAWDNFDA